MEVREELLQIWVPARRWGLSSQHPEGRDRQIELRGQPDLQSKVQASQLDSEILYPKKKRRRKKIENQTHKNFQFGPVDIALQAGLY